MGCLIDNILCLRIALHFLFRSEIILLSRCSVFSCRWYAP